jgi:hypothetical protein
MRVITPSFLPDEPMTSMLARAEEVVVSADVHARSLTASSKSRRNRRRNPVGLTAYTRG